MFVRVGVIIFKAALIDVSDGGGEGGVGVSETEVDVDLKGGGDILVGDEAVEVGDVSDCALRVPTGVPMGSGWEA